MIQPTCLTIAAALLLLSPASAGASDFATRVLDATFKFYHPNSTSTCFLIRGEAEDDAHYLVTSAHTLERTRGETAVLVLREADGNGSFKRHDFTINVRNGDSPLWVQHEKEDVGVLRLLEPLPVEVNALPLSALADEAAFRAAGLHIGGPLLILTYPHRFEAHPSGLPVARRGIFASPPLLPIDEQSSFLADFNTFSGDSGGPAFVEGKDNMPLLVGLVSAQVHHNDTIRSTFEERRVRYPLGLGRVLHAAFIRETIGSAVEAAAAPPEADANEDSEADSTPDEGDYGERPKPPGEMIEEAEGDAEREPEAGAEADVEAGEEPAEQQQRLEVESETRPETEADADDDAEAEAETGAGAQGDNP